MKKKILLALALVAIMTILLAISVSAAEPVEEWDISADGSGSVAAYLYEDDQNSGCYTLTISGQGDMKEWSSKYSVPWYVAKYNTAITSVKIENGVTGICNFAFFEFKSLSYVEISDSVTKIGDSAFYNCSSLKSIVFPSKITAFGDSVLSGCSSLESLTVPFVSFRHAKGEYTHTYPLGWLFGSTSYNGAEAAKQTHYSRRGGPYFSDHYFNTTFYVPVSLKNVAVSNAQLCYGAFSGFANLESVTLPDNITKIPEYAFFGCSSLKGIEIPSGVKAIGTYAFGDCSYLKNIEFPKNSSLAASVLSGCSCLESITVPYVNFVVNNYGSDDRTAYLPLGYLFGTKSYTDSVKVTQNYLLKTSAPSATVAMTETYYIPNSLRNVTVLNANLCNGAFSKLTMITNVVLPDDLTTIPGKCFLNCTSLTSIIIPNSVSVVEANAFDNCSSLTVYAEANSQPSTWNSSWNPDNVDVVWGYTKEVALLESIFTFKGYSFNEMGGFAVGFDIDYEVLAKYEELTGKSLEIGVVFAGLDNLAGKQPLDESGNAIVLEAGKVIKSNLSSFTYSSYDFMLTDIDDSIKDIKLVIAAYIYDGESVKYVQENGISDTVCGISYNEAKESVKE